MRGSMIRILAVFSAIVLLTGCVFTREKFTPVKYYDIGNPDPSKYSSVALRVGAFTVTGPYKQEMVFRTEKNELIKDQYNRWVQTPDVMLKRYLKMAFSEASARKDCTITGNILSFEADLAGKEAVFVIEYRIASSSSTDTLLVEKTSTFKVKYEGASPDSTAGAMATAVASFTEAVAGDLKGKSVNQK